MALQDQNRIHQLVISLLCSKATSLKHLGGIELMSVVNETNRRTITKQQGFYPNFPSKIMPPKDFVESLPKIKISSSLQKETNSAIFIILFIFLFLFDGTFFFLFNRRHFYLILFLAPKTNAMGVFVRVDDHVWLIWSVHYPKRFIELCHVGQGYQVLSFFLLFS